jgi:hypothetical protein
VHLAGRWLVWLGMDMLEINTISTCLPYEAHPCIPVMCHSPSGQLSVTLAVCMTRVLETQNYWSISLPSPLMEAGYAFVKESVLCMNDYVCASLFLNVSIMNVHNYICCVRTTMNSYASWNLCSYLKTLFALRHSHILLH